MEEGTKHLVGYAHWCAFTRGSGAASIACMPLQLLFMCLFTPILRSPIPFSGIADDQTWSERSVGNRYSTIDP